MVLGRYLKLDDSAPEKKDAGIYVQNLLCHSVEILGQWIGQQFL